MNFAHFCEFWCFFPRENKRDSYRTFVPVCPREKFMNWPFLRLVCRGTLGTHRARRARETPVAGPRDRNPNSLSDHVLSFPSEAPET